MNVFSYNSEFTDHPIIKDGETCKAPYELLSSNADTFQCRKLCEEKSDCYFYVVEKNREKGKCYWEKPEIPKTLDKNKICSGKNEGWQAYNYIFYQALSMSIASNSIKIFISIRVGYLLDDDRILSITYFSKQLVWGEKNCQMETCRSMISRLKV